MGDTLNFKVGFKKWSLDSAAATSLAVGNSTPLSWVITDNANRIAAFTAVLSVIVLI